MIRVTGAILIDDGEIRETFVRSSGPGGQNVNKVATAVQLRFDVRNSPSLAEDVRERLARLAGKRMTRDARDRLVGLVRKAAAPPRARRRTVPGPGAKERRLESKRRRSATKRERGRVPSFEP